MSPRTATTSLWVTSASCFRLIMDACPPGTGKAHDKASTPAKFRGELHGVRPLFAAGEHALGRPAADAGDRHEGPFPAPGPAQKFHRRPRASPPPAHGETGRPGHACGPERSAHAALACVWNPKGSA